MDDAEAVKRLSEDLRRLLQGGLPLHELVARYNTLSELAVEGNELRVDA